MTDNDHYERAEAMEMAQDEMEEQRMEWQARLDAADREISEWRRWADTITGGMLPTDQDSREAIDLRLQIAIDANVADRMRIDALENSLTDMLKIASLGSGPVSPASAQHIEQAKQLLTGVEVPSRIAELELIHASLHKKLDAEAEDRENCARWLNERDTRIAELEAGLREALEHWRYPPVTAQEKFRKDELWSLVYP